jgi:hypothetical protein
MTESKKRKFHLSEFKAKVGLEALGGMKTSISRARIWGSSDASRAMEAGDPSSVQGSD